MILSWGHKTITIEPFNSKNHFYIVATQVRNWDSKRWSKTESVLRHHRRWRKFWDFCAQPSSQRHRCRSGLAFKALRYFFSVLPRLSSGYNCCLGTSECLFQHYTPTWRELQATQANRAPRASWTSRLVTLCRLSFECQKHKPIYSCKNHSYLMYTSHWKQNKSSMWDFRDISIYPFWNHMDRPDKYWQLCCCLGYTVHWLAWNTIRRRWNCGMHQQEDQQAPPRGTKLCCC